MSIEPLRFSGVSSYSADFQKILDRTVAIAAQPINALQNDQTRIVAQRSAAQAIQRSVDGLNTAVTALGDIGQTRAVSGTTSNSAKVSIGAVTARSPATYNITDITSLARSSSATSAGFAQSDSGVVSATGSVQLTFNGTTTDIALTPGENTLTGLRDKINNLGVGVTATILTTGSGPTPYYLSITSNTAGEKPIALADDPTGANTNLLAATDNGSNANFKINGVAVSKASNLINDVVSGVTFTITGTTAPSENVSLTLSSSRSGLASKLDSFIAAYNDTRAAADSQIGEAAGLLTGSFIVRETTGLLRQISGFEGTGATKSLAALGVSFGRDGKASLDRVAFDALGETQLQDAFVFLGTPTTGFGALKAKVQQISDPITGLIAAETTRYDATDKRLSARVQELSTRLAFLQKSTSERLQAVDAILGSLDGQKNIIDASFKSVLLGIYGKSTG